MIEPHQKPDIELLLKSNDEQTILDSIMHMTFNVNDPGWIQKKCIEQINLKKTAPPRIAKSIYRTDT